MESLILLSGGQDSTISLFWSIRKFGQGEATALTIDYGQRHKSELHAAQYIASMAGVLWRHLSFSALSEIGDSALVSAEGEVSATHRSSDLPASFVPGRNYLFLGVAAAFAYKIGANSIVAGMSQTDFSGYPDCREAAIRAIELALCEAMDYPFRIYVPLMHLTKADSVRLARTLPGCLEALAYSQTCYEGWFPPCEKCPACKIRARGFEEAGVLDPLILRVREGRS